jgi:hypothetical protein
MNCEQTSEYLSAYIEGELEPGLRLNVDQHLDECDGCRDALSGLFSVYAALDAPALAIEPPGQFHDNLMRRLRVEQRETQRTPSGWWASLNRGWKTAAVGFAAVAMLGVAIAFGPLNEGASAGFGRIPWFKSSQPAALPPSLRIAGTSGGFRQAGEPDVLMMTLAAGQSGKCTVSLRTSPDISLVSRATPDSSGARTVWQGDAIVGHAQAIPLTLTAAGPSSVHEITFRSQAGDSSSMTTVLLPVQTMKAPGARLDWRTAEQSTVRVALSSLAAFTGTPISVPTDALDQPVSINAAGAEPDDMLDAIAVAARLKLDRESGAYNLYR